MLAWWIEVIGTYLPHQFVAYPRFAHSIVAGVQESEWKWARPLRPCLGIGNLLFLPHSIYRIEHQGQPEFKRWENKIHPLMGGAASQIAKEELKVSSLINVNLQSD